MPGKSWWDVAIDVTIDVINERIVTKTTQKTFAQRLFAILAGSKKLLEETVDVSVFL